MLPINPTYRRLIRKYIPQIKAEQLEQYDSYVAFLYQKGFERPPDPTKPPQISAPKKKQTPHPQSSIDELLAELKRYKLYFENAYRLWMARKDYAIQQKSLLQLPASFLMIWQYFYAAIYYRFILIRTLPFLWFNRYRHYLTELFKFRMILPNLVDQKNSRENAV
jgi:hypothetical protein